MCTPPSQEGLKIIRACLESGNMRTKSEDALNYFPVYASFPDSDGIKPFDIGLNKKVQVKRLQTCLGSNTKTHYSRIRIVDKSQSSLDASKDYWIRLNQLECN